MRIGSLFSGYGGLEQGVQSVLGGSTAWVSDIDPGACKILAHRYPDVPNLGDISTVDWSAVEPVDVLTGGFPCQDVSCAGLRKGLRPDTRSGLWTQMAYAIDQLRPALVVAENVRGLLSAEAHSDLEPCPWCVGDGSGVPLRALGAVLGDLAALGYDASWQGLRAADVGAPHGRFRVFVVAWPATTGDSSLRGRNGARSAGGRGEPARPARGSGLHVADSDRPGSQGAQPARGRLLPDGRTAADASSDGRHERRAEPARLVGGSDAALSGAPVAADAHRDGLEGVGRLQSLGRDADGRSGADGSRRQCEPSARSAAADSEGGGLTHVTGRDDQGRSVVGAGSGAGDRDGAGHPPAGVPLVGGSAGVAWGPYEPAVRRWERLTRPAPAPTEPGKTGQPRLSPAFVEWMQGLPAGWVTDVPGLTRNEQLKALGNGVVPQQAAAALSLLLPHVRSAAA